VVHLQQHRQHLNASSF